MDNTNCYFGLPPQSFSRTGFPSINSTLGKSHLLLVLGMSILASGVSLPAHFKLAPSRDTGWQVGIKWCEQREDRGTAGLPFVVLPVTIASLYFSCSTLGRCQVDKSQVLSLVPPLRLILAFAFPLPLEAVTHIMGTDTSVPVITTQKNFRFMAFAPSRLETS